MMRLFRKPGKGCLEVILALVLVIESCLGWAQDISFGSNALRQGFSGLIGLSCVSGRSFLVKVRDSSEGLADEVLRRDLELYFTALAVPQKNWWVNLAEGLLPDEILGKGLEYTRLGKILLEADLKLKEFARRRLLELFEWEDISQQEKMRLRFWIVPVKAEVFVDKKKSVSWVGDVKLKVQVECFGGGKDFCQLVRKRVIPQLERLVNYDLSFSDLRRACKLMALACYGKKLGIYPKDEVDSFNTLGLFSKEYWTTTDMWFRYHSLSHRRDEFGNQLLIYGGFSAKKRFINVRETKRPDGIEAIELKPRLKAKREKGFAELEAVIGLFSVVSIMGLLAIAFCSPYWVITFTIMSWGAIFSFINVIVVRLLVRRKRRKWDLVSQEYVERFRKYVKRRLIVSYALIILPIWLGSWGIWLGFWPQPETFVSFFPSILAGFIGMRLFKDMVEAEKLSELLHLLRRWERLGTVSLELRDEDKELFVTPERDALRIVALNAIFSGKRLRSSLGILWQLSYADLYYAQKGFLGGKFRDVISWLDVQLKSGVHELVDLLKDIPSLRVGMKRFDLELSRTFLDMILDLRYKTKLWNRGLNTVLERVAQKGRGLVWDFSDYPAYSELFDKFREVKEEMKDKYGEDAVMEYKVIWNIATFYAMFRLGNIYQFEKVLKDNSVELGNFVEEFLFLLMKWSAERDNAKLDQLVEMFERLDEKIKEYRREKIQQETRANNISHGHLGEEDEYYIYDGGGSGGYKLRGNVYGHEGEGGINLRDWQIEYQLAK